MQALAMLDAILSPEWDTRYYSFNARWGDEAMMASMRNGQGDQWFAVFSPAGAALHGLALGAPMFRHSRPWPGIFDELPAEFRSLLLGEPAFDTANSTFCVWRLASAARWTRGPVQFASGADPDGSEALLEILAGRPDQYVRFASEYYEVDLDEEDVAAIYGHAKLDPELLERLNPDVSLESLADDMTEIGYPSPEFENS